MDDNRMYEPEKIEFNPLEYLDLAKKYYKLIFVSGVLGAVISLAFFAIKPPQYRAAAKLKIEPEFGDNLRFTTSESWTWGRFYRTEFLNTEFEIMQSLPVVNRVIDKLGVGYFLENAPVKRRSKNLFSLFFPKAEEASGSERSPQKTNENRRKRIRGQLLGHVGVNEIKETNLVNISFVANSPKVAQDVTNEWVYAYIRHGEELKFRSDSRALAFIEGQLGELRESTDKLVVAQSEMQKSVVMLGNTTIEDESVATLNESLLQAEKELIQIGSRYQKLQGTKPSESVEVNQNQLVRLLSQDLTLKQGDYDQKLRVYNAKLPMMRQLQEEISSLQASVQNARDRVYRDLLEDLRTDIKAKNSAMKQIRLSFQQKKDTSASSKREVNSDMLSLNSQIKVNTELMEALKVKREDLNLAIQLKDLNRSQKFVVEEAQLPGGPFAPSLRKYVSVGGALGLLLAVALVFLIEVTDRKIHTVDALEKITGLPTLGMIPKVKKRLLDKASLDFKSKTLSDILEKLQNMPAGKQKSSAELNQMKEIARKSRDEDENHDLKKMSEHKAKELGQIAALANRLLRTGTLSETLEEIYLLSTYAMSLGEEAEGEEKKTETAVRRPRLFGFRSRENGLVDEDEVAYGNHNIKDGGSGIRRLVGCFTHIKPAAPFSESYRQLRTNIQFSDTSEKKVFLLTSSVPGEGKTVSSINLAIAFSQLKKRVLLVDGDLRRPKLHRVFNLGNEGGMVNYLVGQQPNIHECIQHTFVPFLELLSVGAATPNPAELLASDKMVSLVEYLRKTYDFVIIDSSPVLAVADACIIGSLVDAAIFVSKANKSNRDQATQGLHVLHANQIKILGTLFNEIDRSGRIGYSGYGYGYSYGGYGYRAEKA